MLVHADACDDPVPGTHVAVVASRAVGTAVARNRAKRRLRAAAHQARLPDAVDLVVDARRDSLAAPFTTLSRDLSRLSTRAVERSDR